jgi:RNA polymerase sigma-70 factor, ECF subfamily
MGDSELKVIIEQAKKGNDKAQAELVFIFQDKLLKFCLFLCRHRHQAEDLCQDTFVKALKNLPNLIDTERFQSWLYQIAKNLFIDQTRSLSSKSLALDDVAASDLAGLVSQDNIEIVIQVKRVLSQFETEDRLLLILIEVEEYSYREASEFLGMSEDAVRSKLHRLRQIFVKKISGEETNDDSGSS